MGRLCTYADARRHLDSAIADLREQIDDSILDAKQRILGKVAETITDARAAQRVAEGMCAPLREAGHRLAVMAWLTGRAALVGLLLPQNKSRTGQMPVSTRNRRARGTGKRKAFPSDSHLRRARKDGKKERYFNRWLGTFIKTHGSAAELPKLAHISSRRRGRPEVPTQWRNFKRRKARARQLKAARKATAERRKEHGWKPYRRKTQGKGWSNPGETVNGSFRDGVAAMKRARDSARAANIATLKAKAAERRKAWEDKH